MFKSDISILLVTVIAGLAGYSLGRNTETVTVVAENTVRDDAHYSTASNALDCQTSAGSTFNPALSNEFLNTVQQVVAETLRNQLHRELEVVLDDIQPKRTVAVSQSSQLDAETTQKIVSNANELVDEAILRGGWGLADDNQLTDVLQTLSTNDKLLVQKRVSQAINEGKLVLDMGSLLR